MQNPYKYFVLVLHTYISKSSFSLNTKTFLGTFYYYYTTTVCTFEISVFQIHFLAYSDVEHTEDAKAKAKMFYAMIHDSLHEYKTK